ncbi:TIGR03086 family metal-binding protein [Micromonospora echinofusca]|uniref:TIGR03086 family protein n=1 Tax=Micromonospora echinofusca TaxID=47858 RepID=A0ABS3VSG7_MICEH|nr:TIGR03086 family metal-binding protein [Micromonospora echinofusca]MBO4207334.1 TIGR03086 family protein [Micromonospora echinofusca]
MAPDIRELNEQAVRTSIEVVSRVTGDDLARPTPCADWTLADLLAHMTVQHHGFAAASAGNGADPAVWRPRPPGDNPVKEYAEAAEQVVAAFARDGVADRPFTLPELSTTTTFPGALAIRFHFIDYVVHSWDVARALDVDVAFTDEVLHAALRTARAIPDGPERLLPGAAFRPGLPVTEGLDPLAETLTRLGRPPGWPGEPSVKQGPFLYLGV